MTETPGIPPTAYRVLWDTLTGLLEFGETTLSAAELQGFCAAALPDVPADERLWWGRVLQRQLDRTYRRGGFRVVDGSYGLDGLLHALSVQMARGTAADG